MTRASDPSPYDQEGSTVPGTHAPYVSAATLDRRRFLALSGAGALALGGLAGCTTSDASPKPTTAPGVAELDIYTWEGYDLDKEMAAWRASAGVTLKASQVGVQDDVATKLTGPGGTGIDLSTANQAFIDYFNSLQIMSPITTEEVPELTQLFPKFQAAPWKNDDGTYNSVPWTWGPLGYSYVPSRIKPLTSWDGIFDPSLKGRVSMLDDNQQHTQLACAILGFDPDAMTHDQLATVKAFLLKVVRQCNAFAPSTGDQVSQMQNNEIDLVFLGWTGIDAAARDKGFSAVTAIPPNAKSLGFSDASFIPPKADNRDKAIAFCRQLVSGQVAAAAAKTFYAGTTNPKVVPLLDAQTKKAVPYDDIDAYFAKLLFPRGFPRQTGDVVSLDEAVAMWAEVKAEQ